jgi:hypothetical protein
VTLVTGASAGIGAELAKVFAEHGHQTVIVARRKAPLAAVAAAIAAAGHRPPHVVVADLETKDGPARLAKALAARGLEPAIVVNNAGFGLSGMAADLDLNAQLAMIDLNARALTELSLRWIDSLARHHGGILNVASIAGFLPGQGMAVYHASKAYVISLSEALHRELAPRGVRVSVLCPGPVPTEFQGRAGIATDEYPRFLLRSARRVANDGYAGFMQGRRVIVPGFHNRLVIAIERLLPGSMTLGIADRGGRKTARRRR